MYLEVWIRSTRPNRKLAVPENIQQVRDVKRQTNISCESVWWDSCLHLLMSVVMSYCAFFQICVCLKLGQGTRAEPCIKLHNRIKVCRNCITSFDSGFQIPWILWLIWHQSIFHDPLHVSSWNMLRHFRHENSNQIKRDLPGPKYVLAYTLYLLVQLLHILTPPQHNTIWLDFPQVCNTHLLRKQIVQGSSGRMLFACLAVCDIFSERKWQAENARNQKHSGFLKKFRTQQKTKMFFLRTNQALKGQDWKEHIYVYAPEVLAIWCNPEVLIHFHQMHIRFWNRICAQWPQQLMAEGARLKTAFSYNLHADVHSFEQSMTSMMRCAPNKASNWL